MAGFTPGFLICFLIWFLIPSPMLKANQASNSYARRWLSRKPERASLEEPKVEGIGVSARDSSGPRARTDDSNVTTTPGDIK